MHRQAIAPGRVGAPARKLAALLFAGSISWGTSACDDEPSAPSLDETLELDVHVHLVSSPESEALTTTLGDGEVERLFEEVNRVWSQAAVEWRVADVSAATSDGGEAFQGMVEGTRDADPEILWNAIPRDRLTEDVWDVFLIRDLGGMAGGIYFPPLEAVLQPEKAPDGRRDLEGALTRILSHELGHALGLPHVPCTNAGNLMAPGCRSGDRTRLAPQQVDAARDQARRGPYRGGGASL